MKAKKERKGKQIEVKIGGLCEKREENSSENRRTSKRLHLALKGGFRACLPPLLVITSLHFYSLNTGIYHYKVGVHTDGK